MNRPKSKANRERFPIMAEWVDILRAEFPDLKVVYVKEGEEEAGLRLDVVSVPWGSTTSTENR